MKYFSPTEKFLLAVSVIAVLLALLIAYQKFELKEENSKLESFIRESKLRSELLLSEIQVLEERRIILDSLHNSNVKHRNDEKIKLIQNASDSTVKRLVLDYIGPE